jgi:hypothetical protein
MDCATELETMGAVESTTVKFVEQKFMLDAASLTVTPIEVVPKPTWVPASGLCDLLRRPSAVQLSEANTPDSTFGIGALQEPPADTAVGCGHEMKGAVLSCTVTFAEQLLEDDLLSVQVNFTEVIPRA